MSLLLSLELQQEAFQLSLHTSIPAQGVTALYGASGSGKTTLLRWLAGLEKNVSGHLNFKKNLWQDEKHFVPPQQRQIAYVFQQTHLFPHLTVEGNLNYAHQRRFNDNGPTLKQVCSWFELDNLLPRETTQLSGGEKQRVAIARALLSSPQLLLMDEPLASLDSHSKQRILQHLEQLFHHLSIPVIYVSHDLEEISRLADQMLLLEGGKLSAQGSLLELCSQLDLSLSHQPDAASIIEATIHHHDPHYQLSELLIDQQLPLFLTTLNNDVGKTIRIRIPARDISIALEKPNNSSILNILPATIDDIENTNDARVLIRLKVAEQFLLVRLTHKSLDRLQLTIGQQVYAQIKTVALLNEQLQT
jgi:molybdate transport system ATP-binding protein